jgi:hypothetical protein
MRDHQTIAQLALDLGAMTRVVGELRARVDGLERALADQRRASEQQSRAIAELTKLVDDMRKTPPRRSLLGLLGLARIDTNRVMDDADRVGARRT